MEDDDDDAMSHTTTETSGTTFVTSNVVSPSLSPSDGGMRFGLTPRTRRGFSDGMASSIGGTAGAEEMYLSQRQALLDLVYRKLKHALKQNLNEYDRSESGRGRGRGRKTAYKVALETTRKALKDLALSEEFVNDRFPLVRSIRPLPRRMAWVVETVSPFVVCRDGCVPFALDVVEKGLYVVYEVALKVRPPIISPSKLVKPRDETHFVVRRRYREFDGLREGMKQYKYRVLDQFVETHRVRFLYIPKLPPKRSLSLGSRFDPAFVYGRNYQLQTWLDYVCSHSLMQLSLPVYDFLTSNYGNRDELVNDPESLRFLLEQRTHERFAKMQEKYGHSRVALKAIMALIPALENSHKTSRQAIKYAVKSQVDLDKARYLTGISMAQLATQSQESAQAMFSLFGMSLQRTFSPLDIGAFEPLKQILRLWSKQIYPEMRHMCHSVAINDSSKGTEDSIDSDRFAAEWMESERIRQHLLASRLEEMVRTQIKSLTKARESWQQLAVNIEQGRWNNMLDGSYDDLMHESIAARRYGDSDASSFDSRAFPSKATESLDSLSDTDESVTLPPTHSNSSLGRKNSIATKQTRTTKETGKNPQTRYVQSKRLYTSQVRRQYEDDEDSRSVASSGSWLRSTFTSSTQRHQHPSHIEAAATQRQRHDGATTMPSPPTSPISSPNPFASVKEEHVEVESPPPPPPEEKPPMPVNNWIEAHTEDGQTYYYHRITRTSRWVKPTEEMQAKIERRIEASVHEKEKQHQERLNELEQLRRLREQEQELIAKASKEIKPQLDQWDTGQPDLATLLCRLPDLNLPFFSSQDDSSLLDDLKASTPSTLRTDPSKLRKLYRQVVRRIHPDKMNLASSPSQRTLQDKILAQNVFAILAQRHQQHHNLH